MDINTLLLDFARAVSEDDELTGWSRVTYDREPNVYVNMDVRNPPGEADCPYVEIHPAGKTVGQAISVKTHRFEVICCIYDEKSVTHPQSNLVEYEGVRRLEAMRKHVENAIVGVDVGNGIFSEFEIEYDTISMFPFMGASMVFQVEDHVTLGSDPLE
jgi:hypothetical protein